MDYYFVEFNLIIIIIGRAFGVSGHSALRAPASTLFFSVRHIAQLVLFDFVFHPHNL
jgi:hypothetical protein